jgi:dolichol kinase
MLGAKKKLENLAEAEITRAQVLMRSMAIRAAIYCCAATAAFIGFVMLAIACTLYLSEIYGPPAAALITAGIALLLALLLALLAGPLSGRRAREMADRAAKSARGDLAQEFSGIMMLAQVLRKTDKEKNGSWVAPLAVIALVAGFAAGVSPRFRRFFLGKED